MYDKETDKSCCFNTLANTFLLSKDKTSLCRQGQEKLAKGRGLNRALTYFLRMLNQPLLSRPSNEIGYSKKVHNGNHFLFTARHLAMLSACNLLNHT